MELEKIRETFQADRFAAEMGAEILEAEPGRHRHWCLHAYGAPSPWSPATGTPPAV